MARWRPPIRSSSPACPTRSKKLELDGKNRGFILIAVEGRYTTHYYPGPDSNAIGWDNWYRQLNPSGDVIIGGPHIRRISTRLPSITSSPDEVATGEVNRKRIYMMGWSNGAAMAMLYALNRPVDRRRLGLLGAESFWRDERSLSANAGRRRANLQRATAGRQSSRRDDARAQ